MASEIHDPMGQLLALLAGTKMAGGGQQGSMAPMAASEPNRPFQPSVVTTTTQTTPGVKDGRPVNHRSPFEKKVDRATVRGPGAYTQAMRQNLGMKQKTVGYGDPLSKNTSGYTEMVNLFAPAMPAQQVQPVAQPVIQPPGNRPMGAY